MHLACYKWAESVTRVKKMAHPSQIGLTWTWLEESLSGLSESLAHWAKAPTRYDFEAEQNNSEESTHDLEELNNEGDKCFGSSTDYHAPMKFKEDCFPVTLDCTSNLRKIFIECLNDSQYYVSHHAR